MLGKWSAKREGLSKEEIAKIDRSSEQARTAKIEETNRKNNETALQAEEIWKNALGTGESDYLKIKKVEAFGVKYSDDHHGGFLAVPLTDVNSKLWNLQKIYAPNGGNNKWFLTGGKKQGCFHLIGEPLNEVDEIYVSEGYATGASIYMARGRTVVVAFDAGNLDSVIGEIKTKYPNIEVTIAADNDQWKEHNTGDEKARKCELKYNCSIVFPEFGSDHKDSQLTDWNDLHCLVGLEEVRRQLENNHCVAEESKEQIMQRLSKLPPVEYDQQRKKVSKQLGIKTSTLDSEVSKLKKINDLSLKKSKSLELFPEVEPWEKPILGQHLLDEIITILHRFAILPAHADVAIALWVIFTYFTEEVHIAPILAISSPEKQCGKTTLLSLILNLVLRPLPASNISSSCVFRSIEQWKPTLIIDEADTFIADSEELRGILNSGHTKPTAFVIRSVGDDHTPTRFNTWGAKAIALIGKLPDTLHDRSIVIPLRRKLAHEKTEKLRHIQEDIFISLKRKIARFHLDNAEFIKNARPNVPENISDRAADNWEPLLAIAQLAGKEYFNKATEAALVLSGRTKEANSKGIELLQDIKQVFDSKSHLNKIITFDLIEELCVDNEMPWSTWNRGKPLSPRQLSKILSDYNISSKNLKTGFEEVKKGFEKKQFEEVWQRYLSFDEEKVADLSATNDLHATKNTRENAVGSGVAAVAANLEGVEKEHIDRLKIQEVLKNMTPPDSNNDKIYEG